MKGVYVGTDGKQHHGTFGFICLDVYTGPVDPTFATQIHDYDPGITSSGLFWTIAVPDDSVDSEIEDGKARFKLSDLAIPDYGTIVNGLFHIAPPASGMVSFDIRWSGAPSHGSFSNAGQRFTMDFVQAAANTHGH